MTELLTIPAPTSADRAPADDVPTSSDGRPVEAARRRGQASTVADVIGRFAALSWCWFLVWLLLWSAAPAAIGWSSHAVRSGSMEPSLPFGSVVAIDPSIETGSFGPGSIISYADPGRPDVRVTHRVTGVEWHEGAIVGYRTKGDANISVDTMIVPVDDVYGVARLVVPYAGLPSAWMATEQWLKLVLFSAASVVASVLAADTIRRYVAGPSASQRRRATTATAVAIAAMLAAPTTSATFGGTTANATNTIAMTPEWYLDTIDRDGPIAHWRLGEPPVREPVLRDDFTTFAGWSDLGAGAVVQSSDVARSGTTSGAKIGSNDPNGASKVLPTAVSGDFVFEAWVYRPSGSTGGANDRFGVEDRSFDGYTTVIDHRRGRLRIDRRTAGSPTTLSSTVNFDPPEDEWFRVELRRTGPTLTLSTFDAGATLLATVSVDDTTTTTIELVTVRGGHTYYLDDLAVDRVIAPSSIAVDRIGTLDGTYEGLPTLGVPGLVGGQPDTAVRLDGLDDGVRFGDAAAINGTTRAERTLELWFEADSTTGRQILYEEGGSLNGMSVYLDGDTLHARAWSISQGWSNDLDVVTTVTAGRRYHIAVVLDAVTDRSLTLIVDGVPVGVATKTDGAPWNAHTDNAAIGTLNQSTYFHDGWAFDDGGHRFAGVVDEVVLYNRVVPTSNIANHHAAGR